MDTDDAVIRLCARDDRYSRQDADHKNRPSVAELLGAFEGVTKKEAAFGSSNTGRRSVEDPGLPVGELEDGSFTTVVVGHADIHPPDSTVTG